MNAKAVATHTKAWLLALTLAFGALPPLAEADDAEAAPSAAQAFDDYLDQVENLKVPLGDAEAMAEASKRLKALVPEGDAHRMRLWAGNSCYLDYPSDFDAAKAFSESGLEEARAANDVGAEIRFLFCLAGVIEGTGAGARTMALYDEGIALAERHKDDVQLAWGLTYRGVSRSVVGDQAAALIDLLRAQTLFEKYRLTDALESNLPNIATAYRRMGFHAQALEYFEKFEPYARERGDDYSLFVNHLQTGYLHQETKAYDQSLAELEKARAIATRTGDKRDLGIAQLAIASVFVDVDRNDEALQLLRDAQRNLRAADDDSNDGMIALTQGQAHANLGNQSAALEALNRAERKLRSDDNPRYLAMLLRERADVRQASGALDGAINDLREFLAVSESLSQKIRAEQTQFLFMQYDVSRRDLENQRLRAEKAQRDAEVAALAETRKWQTASLALAGVLLLALVVAVVRQLRRSARLRALSLTDPLTGLANRRALELFAEESLKARATSGASLTVLTLDIDYFKRINDTYGHAVGDQVLVRVAQACNKALRAVDRIARTGGEEFVILLPSTPLSPATDVAQRLCDAVAETPMGDLGNGLSVTISIGVAEHVAEDHDFAGTLHRADTALYRAKERGRNRVEVESATP